MANILLIGYGETGFSTGDLIVYMLFIEASLALVVLLRMIVVHL